MFAGLYIKPILLSIKKKKKKKKNRLVISI